MAKWLAAARIEIIAGIETAEESETLALQALQQVIGRMFGNMPPEDIALLTSNPRIQTTIQRLDGGLWTPPNAPPSLAV